MPPRLLLLWPLLSCAAEEYVYVPSCTLDAPLAAPATAAVGDAVVLTSSPLTEVWDTVVTIGGVQAELVSLDRTDCDDCDECVADAGCTECDVQCEDCTETCATCVETVTVLVPALAAGSHPVQVFNRHGHSDLGTLEVLAGDTGDTGAADTGGDTGGADTGDTGDTAGSDTGDTGGADTGAGDTGDGGDTGA